MGLNLLTGGLKPLRNMPEVMSAISALNAGTFTGLLYCVLIAADITAMIHSSSATIGVMGLGASGILDWQTAVAFSLGADLGTTITSWMASLNLSKNAKRAAYAHISFNIIGVLVMLPLFFPSMVLLRWLMGLFGGDPGTAVVVDGKETFPLVPVAVGLYSVPLTFTTPPCSSPSSACPVEDCDAFAAHLRVFPGAEHHPAHPIAKP